MLSKLYQLVTEETQCLIREIVDGCGVFVISVGTVALVLTAIWLYAVMP